MGHPIRPANGPAVNGRAGPIAEAVTTGGTVPLAITNHGETPSRQPRQGLL